MPGKNCLCLIPRIDSRFFPLELLSPVQDKNGLDSKLHSFFGRAPYFIIVKLINGQVSFDKYLSMNFLIKRGILD